VATKGTVTPRVVFVRVPRSNLSAESLPITFVIEGTDSDGQVFSSRRDSVFIGPDR